MREYASCEQAQEEFSALLDGELDEDEQVGVERHLAECSDCLRELDGLKRVSDEYDELPQVLIPDGIHKAVHEELAGPIVKLVDAPRNTQPVSFKPVLLAAVTLLMMAILSALISQTITPSDEDVLSSPAEETGQ